VDFTIRTSRQKDIVDITERVEEAVERSGVKDGICLAFVPHATAALVINEYEPNIKQDFEAMFEKLFPQADYRHNKIDDNAQAHLKSGFVGPDVSMPVENGGLRLGTWQRIMLCEFDGPKERTVIVKVIGK